MKKIRKRLLSVLLALLLMVSVLPFAAAAETWFWNIHKGITGVYDDGGVPYAYTGTTITFTEDSLADADESFMEALFEGAEFTFKMRRTNYYDIEETVELTPSGGTYSLYIPEDHVGVNYVLQIFENGTYAGYSDTFQTRADVTPPSAPTNVRWDGMIGRWDPPATGDLYRYYITVYDENGNWVRDFGMEHAEGRTANYHDFTNNFMNFGPGRYYFRVSANDINGFGAGANSPIYEYTGPVNSYTMIFQPGEGSGSMSSITASGGEWVTLPASTFTAPSGLYFKGWENRGSEYAPGYRFRARSNEVYTAVWTADPSEVLYYGVEMDDITLTAKVGDSNPEGQTVEIRNTGTVRLVSPDVQLTGGNTAAFILSQGSVPGVIPEQDTCTNWYIRPKTGLDPGTYTATLTFTADSIDPLTATVTLTVEDHSIDPNVWQSNNETHWNPCADCSEHVNEAPHDSGVLRNVVAPTFNSDGYSGDRYCSVCGRLLEAGHVVAAGKYIRQSAATMTPATLSSDICASDLVFTSAEPDKYTVELGRVIDTTDRSLNTGAGHTYPVNFPFVSGHTYYIEFRFDSVSPYIYNVESSDYWSTFTLNGAEADQSNAMLLSGTTLRKVELTAQDAGLPVLLTQPQPQTAVAGQMAEFSIEASGAVNYQWQYSTNGGSSWNNCTSEGYNTDTFRFKATAGLSGRLYRCVVSNGSGSTDSNGALLTVITPPVITAQPSDLSVSNGATALFATAAEGAESYQWQVSKDNGATWTNCTGAGHDTDTFSFTAKMSYSGWMYKCLVTNSAGTTPSDPARLTVTSTISITSHPADQAVTAGQKATFKVKASGEDLSYQWQVSKDGGASWTNCTSAGYDTDTFSFTAKASFHGWMYKCRVTNASGSVVSNPAALTVYAKPVITQQPADRTASVGQTVKFTLKATGAGLSWQWQYSKNGSTWTDCTDPGADTDTCSVTAAGSYDGRAYRCVVSNAAGSTVSGTARLTVTTDAAKPAITSLTNGDTSTGITVEWSGVTYASKYQLQRSTDNGKTWITVTSSASGTSYADKGASLMGTTYTYRVCASINGSWYGYSAKESLRRNPFTDVAEDATCFSYVAWGFNNKIVNGTSKTTFSPENTSTRAQFCVLLYKLAGKPAVSGDAPFTDIGGLSGNVRNAVIWAYNEGIIKGMGDGTFNPDGNVTRAQVVIMLYKLAGKPAVSGSTDFEDISGQTANVQKAILWANQTGIAKGTSETTFSPNSECTRAQLVIMLYRFNKIMKYI